MGRMSVTLFLLLLVLYSGNTAVTQMYRPCPSTWTSVASASSPSCYKLIREITNYEAAESECVKLDSHLASFSGIEQFREVHRILKPQLAGFTWYWIGVNDKDADNVFQYTSGAPISFWSGDPPGTRDGGKCVEVIIETEIWSYVPCGAGHKEPYICSKLQDIDECASKPCQHGGNCTDGINSFNCSCPPGFSGITCNTDIDDCSGNPCGNGMFCQDGTNTFSCVTSTTAAPITIGPEGLLLNDTESIIAFIAGIVVVVNRTSSLNEEQFANVSVILSKLDSLISEDPEVARSVFGLIDVISESVPVHSSSTDRSATEKTVESVAASERILETAQQVAESLATPNGTTVVGTNILLTAIRLDNLLLESRPNITTRDGERTKRRTERLSYVVADDSRSTTIEREFSNTTQTNVVRNSASIPLSSLREVANGSLTVTSLVYFNDDLFQVSSSVSNDRTEHRPEVQETVVSSIISATVSGTHGEILIQTEEPVEISLTLTKNISADAQTLEHYCVFWNNSNWETNGCEIARQTETGVVCECSHLTSFAVLLAYEVPVNGQYKTTETEHFLTLVGCSLSLFGFTVTIISIFMSGDLRNRKRRQAKVHVCLFGTLAASFLLFMFGTEATHNPALCYVISAALHYSLLSSFAWMTVEAYLIFKCIVNVLEPWPSAFLRRAMAHSWGFPLLPVIISAAASGEGYIQLNVCWISDLPLTYAFSTFVGAAILFNGSVFGVAMYKLFGSSKAVRAMKTATRARSDHIKKILSSAFLFLLMGSTWILGYFCALDQDTRVIQHLFILLNTTQGFSVFLLYLISNSRAREMWSTLLCGKKGGHRFSSFPSSFIYLLPRRKPIHRSITKEMPSTNEDHSRTLNQSVDMSKYSPEEDKCNALSEKEGLIVEEETTVLLPTLLLEADGNIGLTAISFVNVTCLEASDVRQEKIYVPREKMAGNDSSVLEEDQTSVQCRTDINPDGELTSNIVMSGFPLIPMIVSASLMREDYRRPNLCWITGLPLIYGFSTFVGAAVLFNSTIFGVAIYTLFGSSTDMRATKTSKMARSDHVKNILSSTFLYVLLGTTWILGYFSVLDQKVRLVQYLFITLNTTQGFTVFLLYIITNPRARKMWGTILSEKFFTPSSSSVPPPEEVYRKPQATCSSKS